jgi:hypothetical protein
MDDQIKNFDIDGLVGNKIFLFKMDFQSKKNIAALQCLLQNSFGISGEVN